MYDNIVPGVSPNDKGHLFLDSLVLAPAADLSSLITPTPKIDCTFDAAFLSASGQPAGHTWVISNNNLTVQTTSSTDNRVGTTHNQFIFFSLPANNSGFGNHQETLTYQGNSIAKANIQTFFLAGASNYPGAAADYNASNGDPTKRYWTPNWYHYYKQIYPTTSSGYTVNYDGNSSNPNVGAYTQANSPFGIYITKNTYPYWQLRVYALDMTNPADQTKKITYIGYLDVPRLMSYIATAAHERGHQSAFQASVPPAASPIYTIATGSPLVWPKTGDGDMLVDAWENNHHMSSVTSDTTHSYGKTDLHGNLSGGDIPDNEVIADIPALPELFNHIGLWKQDWAGGGTLADGTNTAGGLQWGVPSSFPDLFLTFHPVASTALNPDGSYNYGTPYGVNTVLDIQIPSVFPNAASMAVLTALP